jgi:hypothetical protein
MIWDAFVSERVAKLISDKTNIIVIRGLFNTLFFYGHKGEGGGGGKITTNCKII